MKQVRIGLLILAVLLFGALTFVRAQEDDNACYAGAALDSKCKSDWEWVCGYYLEQWTEAGGWSGNYAFPDWCDPASLLPPKPQVSVTSLAGCYTNGTQSFYYAGTRTSEIPWNHSATDCSATHTHEGTGLEVATQAEAEAICDTLVDYPYVWNPSQKGYNSPANLWLCEND